MLEVLSVKESAGQPTVTLSVNGRCVSRNALNKALYWLSEDYAVEVHTASCGGAANHVLELTIKAGQDVKTSIESVRRSLLDFAVRENIEAQTNQVRTEIVTAALRALHRGGS